MVQRLATGTYGVRWRARQHCSWHGKQAMNQKGQKLPSWIRTVLSRKGTTSEHFSRVLAAGGAQRAREEMAPRMLGFCRALGSSEREGMVVAGFVDRPPTSGKLSQDNPSVSVLGPGSRRQRISGSTWKSRCRRQGSAGHRLSSGFYLYP